jgi:hypothetical protein
MPKIFISYRRQDSNYAAAALCDRLRTRYGRENVFMDVDAILPGVDFRRFILDAVSECDVFLALIGKGWFGQAPDGSRRLDDPRDFVRIEIEAALARDIPIIPILIGPVRMPAQSELPASVSEIAYRNAIEVDYGRDFSVQVDGLIKGIERQLDFYSQRPGQAAQPAKGRVLRAYVEALLNGVSQVFSLERAAPPKSGSGSNAKLPKPVDEVTSPYVVGRPVHGELFVGRRDILKLIENNIRPSAGKNVLVLRGQRRSGKTSVLLRLRDTLATTSKGSYLPVFADLQGLVGTRDEGQFFYSLAHRIWKDLTRHNVVVPQPALAEYVQAPTTTFELVFLERVESALAGRHVLLMLDEFEKIKLLIDNGSLSENVLDYFRHLMQHSPLLFLIAGTQKLRELTGGYWSVFFNLALPIDIGVLKREDAERLITEPVSRWYRIEPEGVAEIIRAAGCHPYFTQLVCRTLLEVRNEHRLRLLTFEHVLDALDRALKSGGEQIGYPWTEEDCSSDERLVLAVLAHEGADGRPVPSAEIREEFKRRSLPPINPAVERLQVRSVLKQNDRAELLFTVPLFQKWLVLNSYDSVETATQYNRERELAAEKRERLPS